MEDGKRTWWEDAIFLVGAVLMSFAFFPWNVPALLGWLVWWLLDVRRERRAQ